jgi:hypothetical protein
MVNNSADVSVFESAAGISMLGFGSLVMYLVMFLFLVVMINSVIGAYVSWSEEDISFMQMKASIWRSIIFFCIVSSLLGFGNYNY